MTPDVEAAKRFYVKVFGWQPGEPAPPEAGGYIQFNCQGRSVAGMGEMGPEMRDSGMPAVWNSYVAVESADATASRASELGAKVEVAPMDVLTV